MNKLPQYQVAIEGRDLGEVVAEVAPEKIGDPQLVVLLNGVDVADRMAGINLVESDRVVIGLIPAGGGGGKGKSVGSIVVGIILVVASIYSGGTAWAAYSGAMMSMGAGLILSGVSGLLIKPPSLNASPAGGASLGTTAFMGGQSNQSKPYGVIPKIYGRHRMFPNLAATPLIDNIGTSSEIAAIYDFGYGNVEVDTTQVRIGESLAATFLPEFKLWQNTSDIKPILATSSVHYDQLAFVPQPGVAATFTTKAGTLQAVVDLGFTMGLYYIDQYGRQNGTCIEVVIEWAPTGTQNWTRVDAGQVRGVHCYNPGWRPPYPANHLNQKAIETFTGEGVIIYERLVQPGVASVLIAFPTAGQYDIRIRRTTPIWTGADTIKVPGLINGEDTWIPSNSMSISLIKSRLGGAMFNLKKRHTMLEMRLTASEKLSGVVQNMSCVVTSILKTYDAQGNVTGEIPTRNPAWCALDVMLGDANPRPLRPEQIDWPAWVYLAQKCDEQRTWHMIQEDGTAVDATDNRFHCDMVLDSKGTVGEVLDAILSICRAMRVITSTGKYSVALDEEQTVPRTLITHDNSWDFSGTRTFTDTLHAVRVKFTAAEHDWQQMEVMVYADGYGPVAEGSTKAAENVETLESLGITDAPHAWAYGRYMLAQSVLRAETFTVMMDIENLVIQRGNLVYVAHPVPNIGGAATRISSVVGGIIRVAALPETLPNGYIVRQFDGTIRQGAVTAVDANGDIHLDNAANLHADDLIVLGTMTKVIKPYIVQSISPGENMSASVQLAAYDENLYRADIHDMPVWNPGFNDESGGVSNLIVNDLTNTQSFVTAASAAPKIANDLTWKVSGYGYTSADIYAFNAGVRTLIGTALNGVQSYRWLVDLAANPELAGVTKIMVVPNSISGGAGVPQTIEITNSYDATPPGRVTNLQLTGTTLTWTPPGDSDLSHFDIATGATMASAVKIGGVPAGTNTYTIADGSITYYVRAVDSSGNIGPYTSTNPSGWGLNWGHDWGN